ncbi:MAG: tryptophan-rich sensory protein [Armatimonadetes bacterium]|nr:tryptophan-rich sensory protein [Armatimonadota bacterium]
MDKMGSVAKQVLALVLWIGVCLAAGFIGGLYTESSVSTWYVSLRKPDFNPPNWVFAPVWTTLYTLMGIAAWLVWRKGWKNTSVKTALIVFGVQLVLNTAWSIIFFGLRMPGAAFFELIALWIAIVATIALFFRLSILAGALLVPYILWVSFAAVLNYLVWRLNP